MQSIGWLVFFLILVVIEIQTMALTTIWFAGGALIAFLLSLFGVGLMPQLVVFVVVSFAMLFLTRPWAARFLNKKTVKTNAESLIGQEARVTAEINNQLGTGTVVVNGMEWTARAADAKEIYPVQTPVLIREIRGVKLIVTKKQEVD